MPPGTGCTFLSAALKMWDGQAPAGPDLWPHGAGAVGLGMWSDAFSPQGFFWTSQGKAVLTTP